MLSISKKINLSPFLGISPLSGRTPTEGCGHRHEGWGRFQAKGRENHRRYQIFQTPGLMNWKRGWTINPFFIGDRGYIHTIAAESCFVLHTDTRQNHATIPNQSLKIGVDESWTPNSTAMIMIKEKGTDLFFIATGPDFRVVNVKKINLSPFLLFW